MKRCSIVLVTKEMKIKTTMSYFYKSVRMVKIQRTEHIPVSMRTTMCKNWKTYMLLGGM